MVYGARISLAIGVAATVGSVLISGFLGAVCGYYGGKVDAVIMRIMDMFLAIPTELLACLLYTSRIRGFSLITFSLSCSTL